MTWPDDVEGRWAPKMHPLHRPGEPEDPLELMGGAIPGDPDTMLECVLQEFAWLGYDADQLMDLFLHPAYPVLGQLRLQFGDSELRRRVESLVAQWGVLRFRETIAEPDDESDDESTPPLFQIQLPAAAEGADPCGNPAPTRGL